MRRLIVALALGAALAMGAQGQAYAQAAPTNGEVTKVDESGGRLTIRHEPIKNLNMDAMTMVFRVADPSMLKSVKPGDKVVFEADRVNGAITVTSIKKQQ